jgi:hypothetical protein
VAIIVTVPVASRVTYRFRHALVRAVVDRRIVSSEVYELMDRQDALPPEDDQAIKDFWQAVIYYREGRAEEALLTFSQLRSKRPSDRPLQYFIERAQARLLETSDHSGPSGDLFMRHGHARILQSL